MLIKLLKRRTVIALIFFSLGFVSSAYLGTKNVSIFDNPLNQVSSSAESVLALPTTRQIKIVPPLVTEVDFDGTNFSKSTVQIEQGRYIGIKNTSNSQLMWLISSNSLLNTQRGFGQSEMLKVMLTTPGTFQVVNKLKPSSVLTVTIYKPT